MKLHERVFLLKQEACRISVEISVDIPLGQFYRSNTTNSISKFYSLTYFCLFVHFLICGLASALYLLTAVPSLPPHLYI